MFTKENSFFSDLKDKCLFKHKKDADSWILQLASFSQLCSFLSLSDLCLSLSLSDFSHFTSGLSRKAGLFCGLQGR